jgi:hypothetical protein
MPQHDLNVQAAGMRIGAQFDSADEVAVWNVVRSDARGRPTVGLRLGPPQDHRHLHPSVPCKPCALQPELESHVLYVTSATPLLGDVRGSTAEFPQTVLWSDTSSTYLGIPPRPRPRQSATRLRVTTPPLTCASRPESLLLNRIERVFTSTGV